MEKSDIMYGICGAQDILQKEQYLMQGYFVKKFIFFKAHPLPKEHEVFQYRTKSPGLNHPSISAVSTGFHFQKQLLDFPSTIAHGSTVGPFKPLFKSIFGKQNTNFHDSSISVDADYSNRFLNSTQRCTLYPLVRFLQSHRREI
jgi:hypothetical protein